MPRQRLKFPYWEWEDYQAGLYDLTGPGTEDHAIVVLQTVSTLVHEMHRAVEAWPKAAAHHLTDGGMNQRAWLGWAACFRARGVPAHRTRAAWWRLSEQERVAANGCADIVIGRYVAPYAKTLFSDECA